MKTSRFIILCFIILISCVGCSKPATQPNVSPTPSFEQMSYYTHQGRFKTSEKQYSQSDYDWMVETKSNYETQSVAQFNRKVLDWEDEEVFHIHEMSLQRLLWSLPEEDKNYSYLNTTLQTTWNECEKKHYNICERNAHPLHDQWIELNTYGDVYGDQVLLTTASLSYNFNYSIPNEESITVSQRDEQLKQIKTQLTTFLNQQKESDLKQEETMKKTCKTELDKILVSLTQGIQWEKESQVSYWWDQSWDDEQDATIKSSESNVMFEQEDWSKPYTQAQYDLVMQKLKIANYETMSVANFNKTIHHVFEDLADDEYHTFYYAYEKVLDMIEETDLNYHYLTHVIQQAIEEYDAKQKTVLSRKEINPEKRQSHEVSVKKDVFGDEVVVGEMMLDFNYTYRILQADQLTMSQKEQFFTELDEKIQTWMTESSSGKLLSESDVKKKIDELGKAASNELIEYVECELDYVSSFDGYWDVEHATDAISE